jgi:hypothetical protein
MLDKKGKGRITLQATIYNKNKLALTYLGEFVAMESKIIA